MATSQLRKSKGWNRAVSRKFYDYIAERVRSVASLSNRIREQYMMCAIDDYIANGTVWGGFSDMETVVFTLVQPLIDKAMYRSRRARECAARRKQQRQAAVYDYHSESCSKEAVASGEVTDDAVKGCADSQLQCGPGDTTDLKADTTPKDATKTTPPTISREEKRAMRREEARNRRKRKHIQRLNRRCANPSNQSSILS